MSPPIDPGEGIRDDLLRVHSEEFIQAVEKVSQDGQPNYEFGLGTGDNPAFHGVYEAALAYTSGSATAARAVRDGAYLAFNIGGGLHHAQRSLASGFCTFNDCAVAAHILREKFERVIYIDIDVHHGDGVQWIFYEDPTVMTCSIHQDGRTIYPGTGWVDETGANFSSINVPMWPGTTGDVWLESFKAGIMAAIGKFKPQAIVLQMGTDAQFLDRLGNLNVTAQEWCEAVALVRDFGVPIVALGGGGYTITCVPRMWIAACLTLANKEVPEHLPEPFASEWSMPRFFDYEIPAPRGQGADQANKVIRWLEANALPNIRI